MGRVYPEAPSGLRISLCGLVASAPGLLRLRASCVHVLSAWGATLEWNSFLPDPELDYRAPAGFTAFLGSLRAAGGE